MADKRASSPETNGGSELVLKKQKTETGAIVRATPKSNDGPDRTSALLAPTMLLSGHAGEVFTAKFSPDGTVVASGSHDKHLFFWRTYGECENFMMIKGHKNAILDLHWTTDGERVITASPDMTVRAWDTKTGEQVKKMTEHDNFVNSCCPLRRGPPLLVSGSDDTSSKVWDLRQRESVVTLQDTYQVCSVAFSAAGDQVYTGGIENVIKAWDLRRNAVLFSMTGHKDTVTSMRVSPDHGGDFLLTNAMDNTLRVWDMRPFAPSNRCMKIFTGHQHNYEKNLLKCDWSPDGTKIATGSADSSVYVWEVASRKLLYQLPGHKGTVNEAVFHPIEPIICSASSDRQIYLGELAD